MDNPKKKIVKLFIDKKLVFMASDELTINIISSMNALDTIVLSDQEYRFIGNRRYNANAGILSREVNIVVGP